MKRKALKTALISCIILLFAITLLPMFNPIMNIVRQIIGSCMIGWWTGQVISKIINK